MVATRRLKYTPRVSQKKQFFTSFDGARMEGRLYPTNRKKKNEKKPSWHVLLFPGMGYSHVERYTESLVDAFRAHGCSVTLINLRGHDHSEGEFLFTDLCKDVAYFTNRLAKQHKKLIVFGHSTSASALLATNQKIPAGVRLAIFAPIDRLDHRVPTFLVRIVDTGPRWLTALLVRLALAFTNFKSGNYKRTGLRRICNMYGRCRVHDHKTFWNELMRFRFAFPKVKQRGALLYGDHDKLIGSYERFERAVKRTGLTPVLLEGWGHHFKSRRRNALKEKTNLLVEKILENV